MRLRVLACASLALFAGLGLSGCATFEGTPERLLGRTASDALVNRHQIDQAIRAFEETTDSGARKGLTRQQYRDMVVTVYMNAMDSRYYEFRTALSSERRQTDFGLDLAVLGFTGWASVAKASIVNNLSAVAAGFAGTRAVANKDLYFDQALPALIAAMDADRLRARAAMVTNLQKSAGDYPLTTAFSDLLGYEVASSLDGAVTRITTEAVQDRENATDELAAAVAVRSCQADADATPVVSRINRYLRSLTNPVAPLTAATATSKLRLIAVEMQLPPDVIAAENADDIRIAIMTKVTAGKDGRCGKAGLEDLIARIEARTKDTVAP